MFYTQDPGQSIAPSCVPSGEKQASLVLSVIPLLMLWKAFAPAFFSWGGLALITSAFWG